jgi:hypothetical protein
MSQEDVERLSLEAGAPLFPRDYPETAAGEVHLSFTVRR